jgi:NAD(P)H-quinone oxidoreductase subunit 6
MPSVATLVFWFIVLLTVGSAILVVTARNILHAAFSLCLTFLGVAGLYIFLHADFVAAVQLIVYVGGILVLIMFAVMFSSNVVEDTAEGGRSSKLGMIAGGIIAFVMLFAMVRMIDKLSNTPAQDYRTMARAGQGVQLPGQVATVAPLVASNQHGAEPFAPTVSVRPGETSIGHLLMGQYLLPFEFVSVLLLAALIGAVVIVRKELT